ncbi:hypothetical protein PsorP6_017231 [Peronosclerospora sorghi]|uniref:Uncharacterized protein n=1 Tax=Peronosclerospora sorghi TaxID=230839 RepID=A0ACC0WCM6_9STRA|nr:hypothetical protein PsorP6_017231 [Peronosclerospora sorghi]
METLLVKEAICWLLQSRVTSRALFEMGTLGYLFHLNYTKTTGTNEADEIRIGGRKEYLLETLSHTWSAQVNVNRYVKQYLPTSINKIITGTEVKTCYCRWIHRKYLGTMSYQPKLNHSGEVSLL